MRGRDTGLDRSQKARLTRQQTVAHGHRLPEIERGKRLETLIRCRISATSSINSAALSISPCWISPVDFIRSRWTPRTLTRLRFLRLTDTFNSPECRLDLKTLLCYIRNAPPTIYFHRYIFIFLIFLNPFLSAFV